jgi:predicted O-methyltransferase YrrM
VLLEFGSGCSTLVLALALSRNGVDHLWSVDSEEKWAATTESALPAELRSCVTIVRSPVAEDDRDAPGLTHSRLPDVKPDFVFVDGPPSPRRDRSHSTSSTLRRPSSQAA